MYGNPYLQTQNPNYYQQPMQVQRHEIVKVHGENGAKAFQMAPNSSVLLLDETEPIVWLKTTDGAGYPSLTPYAITPYKKEEPVDAIKALDIRISKLEELMNESNPESAKPKRSKSADPAD